MYLKSIKSHGFKSFADVTELELKKGITGVVGPNGSGKSNIVDAIRWVLGEQSVKSLRGGDNMSDVIFSGSEYKEALNKASVTLTFDNSDKYLNSEFNEIEVKRCVYKTGENEYYLNNTKVRLKDITELFIDSGGLESYNIISQGTVTDLVNYKPQERRWIFESAARVLKYKKRKEESLRKLEKTEDNLNSVNLVINELEISLKPLKEQASVAKKYLEFKDELKNKEIALITKDIQVLNTEYNNLKAKEDELKNKLETIQNNVNNDAIEKLKLEIYKIDDQLSMKNKQILTLTEEISKLDSEKRITIERTKYEYSEDKIKNNLINLKEEELNLIKEIEIINNEIDILNNTIKEKNTNCTNINNEYKNILLKKNTYNKDLEDLNKEQLILENKIDILESNILNNEKLPLSVKNILNNDRLKGIHNTIGNLVNISNEYLTASDVILSSSANFIIVDNENCAKEAINYLRDKNIGRATFLPLNIIKSRYIDEFTLNKIKSNSGFVGILSDLINYDPIYKNIMENQLGNVIVVRNIDDMNNIAKIIDYKYRVVSLDGSIIYSGGIISGGVNKKNTNINLKKDLEECQSKLDNVRKRINNLKEELNNIDNDYNIINNNLNNINLELVQLNTAKESKLNNVNDLDNKLNVIRNDIMGLSNLKENVIDDALNNIMERLNKLTIEKEKMEDDIESLKEKKNDYNNELDNLEKENSKVNSEYKIISNSLNSTSVEVGKLNVKLDSLLLTLNEEYSMTYEYAKDNYDLDIDSDITRKMVNKLKNDIKSLGEVNTGSISEYERINTRYEFLVNQKNDLEISMQNLHNIINDMDNIMVEKFKDTFTKVSDEFSKVFKIMFQGGTGKLVLTDPNDYLNTGIDMIVIPPGKKIHNTQSLSGGEKSLTAICLLFAILNVSTVPFIVLDEVEAALDEANVDLFGEYLNKKKLDSQYILITHKKRMMEYADVLYGITMQNAGISKVVGVELENIK